MAAQVVIDREDVHAKRWMPIEEYRGVTQKVLWEDGQSRAGLLHLEPGAHIPEHVHHLGVHHIWVVEGVVGLGREALGPGSYCFVPAGSEHEVLEVGLEGATLFYLYLRPAPQAPSISAN